jgi:Phage integrase family
LVLPTIIPLYESSATTVRDLTLNEDFDGYGRLIQRRDPVLNDGTAARARDFTASYSEKAARFTKVALHLERGWPPIYRRPGIYKKSSVRPPLILGFGTHPSFLKPHSARSI